MSIDFTLDEDGIAVVTINRPEVRNALDGDHYRWLSEAWCRVRDDPAVRVAIVTGAGDRAFCAGADLKSWIGREQPLQGVWQTQADPILNRGLEVWKPVIAAINGVCVGGGVTLMLATDLRLAVPGVAFGLSEVKRGIIAANGGTQRVLRQLPYAVGMKMLLTGATIDSAEALRWGLINEIVEPDRLLPRAMQLAREIAANAPLAVQAAKELAVRGQDMSLAEGLRMEQLVNRLLQGSSDVAEGRAAFAEKRTPRFEGR